MRQELKGGGQNEVGIDGILNGRQCILYVYFLVVKLDFKIIIISIYKINKIR